jgi:hypothetical protein
VLPLFFGKYEDTYLSTVPFVFQNTVVVWARGQGASVLSLQLIGICLMGSTVDPQRVLQEQERQQHQQGAATPGGVCDMAGHCMQ